MKGDLVVRLGEGHSRWLIVLRDYTGSFCINQQLRDAIHQRCIDKYGDSAITEFDIIEIVGWDEQKGEMTSDCEAKRAPMRN